MSTARDCPHCNYTGTVHCGDVADKIKANGGQPGDCSNAKVYGLKVQRAQREREALKLAQRLEDREDPFYEIAAKAALELRRLAAVEAEVERLRADKDRIDWLTQHGATIYTRRGEAIYERHGFATIRSAIDDARVPRQIF